MRGNYGRPGFRGKCEATRGRSDHDRARWCRNVAHSILAPKGFGACKGHSCSFYRRTEFIEKYCEVIGETDGSRLAVATLDWRGQGRSSRAHDNHLKGHVEDFTEFDADTEAFVRGGHAPKLSRAPISCWRIRWAATLHSDILSNSDCVIDRAVLVAPMTGVLTKPIPLWVARFMAWAGTKMGIGDSFVPGGAGVDPVEETFEENAVTSDKLRFDRYKSLISAEPKLALGAPTYSWLLCSVSHNVRSVLARTSCQN